MTSARFDTARSGFDTSRSAFDTARGLPSPAEGYQVDAGAGDIASMLGGLDVGEAGLLPAAALAAEPAAAEADEAAHFGGYTEEGYVVDPSAGLEGATDAPGDEGARGGELGGDAVRDVFSLARHNRIDDVGELLDRGMPVDVADAHGNTILIIACQNGLKRMAKLALRRGCDMDARNSRGNTALHFCYAYGYGDSLGTYLLSKGADATVRNHAGFVPHEGIG